LNYGSTLLPQTNDPPEIQKAILDLLQKINQVSTVADNNARITANSASLDDVTYFSNSISIPNYAPNGLYVMQSETANTIVSLPGRNYSIIGARYNFRKGSSGAFTLTVSATGNDTIGSTNSITFVLYNQDDFVTLENDGKTWAVVATSGPIQSVTQTAFASNNTAAWVDLGTASGLTFSLPAGSWLITAYINIFLTYVAGGAFYGIYSNTTSNIISHKAYIISTTNVAQEANLQAKIVLASPTTIAISAYASGGSTFTLPYDANFYYGKLFAQRLA
jgi:hypothetical protein